MAFKLVVCGEPNAGKTSLTEGVKNSLVISHDGKPYPFPAPHALLDTVESGSGITDFVSDKVGAYEEKFGNPPDVIIFDSISRIYESLYDLCNTKYTNFAIYSNLDKEIKEVADLLEDIVASGINVVIISHASLNTETSKYELVGKGSFNKLGGFLSVVDESIFIETKNNKRVVHFRSTKFPARTLCKDLPDSMPVKDFTLASHLERLEEMSFIAADYAL